MEWHVPNDFDWEIYRELNQDLIDSHLDTQEQIVDHWNRHGYYERRKYRLEQNYPNFDWEKYQERNPILKKFLSTPRDYQIHWLRYGRKDYLNLKYSDIPDDENFNWRIYCHFNPDLKRERIDTEGKAISHWQKYGRFENRIYKMDQLFPSFDWRRYQSYINNNKNNKIINLLNRTETEFAYLQSIQPKKNCLIIMSHRVGGGLSKYVNDVINSIDRLLFDSEDYDIFTNENVNISSPVKPLIQLISDSKICDIGSFYKQYHKVILHFNIFPKYYTYTHSQIESFFDKFFTLKREGKKEMKLIITIHDFFWIYPANPNILIRDFESSVSSDQNIQVVNKIFSQADLVIFPTQQFQNHYYRKGIDIEKIRSRIIPHIDIYQYDPIVNPYLPLFQDKIKILFVGNGNVIKGFHHLSSLSQVKPTDSNYSLEFHLLGKFNLIGDLGTKVIHHGEYQNHQFYSILKKIEPTLLLLLSESYESYSYTLTMFLKSGLPIFYNQLVFEERISKYENSIRTECNFYPYTENICEKFQECIDHLVLKKNQGIPHQKINDDLLHIPSLYLNLYNRDFSVDRVKIEKDRLSKMYQDHSETYSKIHQQIRPFAIYFPQFHRIKENDINFYNGFTDMNNLRRYIQMNYNQVESRNKEIITPIEEFLDYYDLLIDDNIIDRQVEIAKSYGIYGFAIYHYWFGNGEKNNHAVMSKVIEKIFTKKYDNFYFYLIWANENWEPKNSLSNKPCHLVQDYNNQEIIKKHFEYLLPIFEHPNYYHIEGHPFFCIHHPWFISNDQILLYQSVFDKLSQSHNLNSVVWGCNQLINSESNHNFPIKYYNHSNYKINTSFVGKDGNKNLISYPQYLENLYDRDVQEGILSVFCGFDNQVRLLDSQIHPTRFIDDHLSYFDLFLQKQFQHYQEIVSNPCVNQKNIFLINAWNEWGEYMAIEPSNQRGYQYLEIIQKNLIKFFNTSI